MFILDNIYIKRLLFTNCILAYPLLRYKKRAVPSRELPRQLNNKLITNENLFTCNYVPAMLGTANCSKTRDGL